MPEDVPAAGVSRRDLLRKAGLGGAALLGGSLLGAAALGGESAGEAGGGDEADGYTVVGSDVVDDVYGGLHGPPPGLSAAARDAATFPPPPDGRPAGTVRHIEIAVEESLIEVAGGVSFEAWTYNGVVPAPTIRATEGDMLRIHLVNRTGHPHNLHFHGAHRPDQDGWEPVRAGWDTTYEIEAGPAGVHPFHSHTDPLAEHIARGLYGTLIVDPVGGAPARPRSDPDPFRL